eukprot:SAG11_NODE_16_length_26235_cov_39.900417_2_plen_111_part_00
MDNLTVKTALAVRTAGLKLAQRKKLRLLRQVFVAYSETFQKSRTEETVVRLAFDKIDADDSGYIDADEFRAIVSELGLKISEAQITEALLIMDENGDNEIEFHEFRDWWA